MKTLLTFLLCALTAQAATVRLMWDRNPEPDVVEYKIYWGTSPRAQQLYSNIESAGNVTEYRATNLELGRTYFFAVTAVNSAGLESDFSNEVVYTVPSRPTAPTNPRVLFESASWTGRTNKAGAITPVLVVAGDPGLTVRAQIVSPAGPVSRTATIPQSRRVELLGRQSNPPFTASADILTASVDPDVQTTAEFR